MDILIICSLMYISCMPAISDNMYILPLLVFSKNIFVYPTQGLLLVRLIYRFEPLSSVVVIQLIILGLASLLWLGGWVIICCSVRMEPISQESKIKKAPLTIILFKKKETKFRNKLKTFTKIFLLLLCIGAGGGGGEIFFNLSCYFKQHLMVNRNNP